MKNFQQSNRLDYDEYGAKAARLFKAGEKGLLIPEGFALSYQEFDDYLEENQLKYLLQDEVVNGPILQDKILEGRFSESFREKLRSELDQIKERTQCNSFVVRSSSSSEDGGLNSMAGMYESYLKLTTISEVEDAIRRCYSALYSDKVLNFNLEKIHSSREQKMGVLIQEYVEGDSFGVMFTNDPVNWQENRIHLSIFEGDSAKLLQMAPSTGIFSLNKETGALTAGSDTQSATAPGDALCRALISLAQDSEVMFGVSLDIEWTWREDRLYLLQVRPITSLKKEALHPIWTDPIQEQQEWFRLYQRPLTPLMQDIIASEIREQSKASYETLFRTDTYGECIILQGYAYVRSIPIEGEGEKRKAYLAYLEELSKQGVCIYHDIHLPTLQAYEGRLKDFANRSLTREEIQEYLKLAMEYHDYCARYHWNMVQANEFLYRFEREFLSSFPAMSLSDFYDLVSGYTLQTRDRELLFHMSDAVKKSNLLKELFAACPYDAVLYKRLLAIKEAEELLTLIRKYLEIFGLCDSLEGEVLMPVLQERPDYILGYLRRVLDLDSKEFFENIGSAMVKRDHILKQVMEQLEEKKQKDFSQKLMLAQKAFLSNDNHNYYVERLFRGYLRTAVQKAEELLLEERTIEEKDDIQYFYYEELLSMLQGEAPDEQLLSRRRMEHEYHMSLEAPELFAGNKEEDKQTSLENFVQKMKKNRVPIEEGVYPSILKGVSGLRKRSRGRIYVGIPDQPQEAILVMPHCHYGDIMPVISKVKGLIFLWGSPYDHPAIIARELGIPAMYYVAGAMDLLKTGDEVEIDGYEGLIHIISRAEETKSGIS